MIHVAKMKIVGTAPLTWTRNVRKPSGISHKKFETDHWRDRFHSTPDGRVVIPRMAWMQCLRESAQRFPVKIGMKSAHGYFLCGIMVEEDTVLNVKLADVPGYWKDVPSDGRPGGGKRVDKCFGAIQEWSATVVFTIYIEQITKEIFAEVARNAGLCIGVGCWRIGRGGLHGRFSIPSIEWDGVKLDEKLLSGDVVGSVEEERDRAAAPMNGAEELVAAGPPARRRR